MAEKKTKAKVAAEEDESIWTNHVFDRLFTARESQVDSVLENLTGNKGLSDPDRLEQGATSDESASSEEV